MQLEQKQIIQVTLTIGLYYDYKEKDAKGSRLIPMKEFPESSDKYNDNWPLEIAFRNTLNAWFNKKKKSTEEKEKSTKFK